ncbi:multi -bridging factor 1b [Micractinium conductrix]|uniref:Multi -bridging factor 1b n=1 Tax=Micractinium conductrix TaxID=554055 RepID=A0A2P6V1Q8_9CHLO|nr:multi -bridging factor 1b [Micractinium conductrix]|eukprot:PSC68031.1 multi -bridging factor 1b [Micractinium conductrix]
MHMGGSQDWDQVVIRKKAPNSAAAKNPAAVNAAIRAGAEVETVKKVVTNASAARGPIKSAVKLENDTNTFEHDRVSSELKKQIQSARLAKKLTQAQLAQMINEKPQLINEYESGKAIPNPQILSKMSRVLGVTLKKNPSKKKPRRRPGEIRV